ncbi:MAG: DUF1415 domain-containing protein [Myxococcota bacterium]
MSSTSERVHDTVDAWLREAVIGLNLCPFAAKPYRGGETLIVVSDASRLEDAVFDAVQAAFELMETPPNETRTTLVAFPSALHDFDEYLDAADALRATLQDAGASGVLQVATFHPDYQFADTEPDAVENYTNRAPYPILHILREDDVTEAVESHPNPEAIPERNIEKMREMGREALEDLWDDFSPE